MKKFREVDLHSYLEKYGFQNKFLNLSERNAERFENKYKKFGLDRNRYIYDEFLLDKGENLQKNAKGMEQKAVKAFETIGDPGTNVFVEKMEDIVQIYNHTEQICFDNEKIYLLA